MFTNPHISQEIAHEHQRDLMAQADQQRQVLQARAGRLELRRLEKTGSWTRPERMRSLWYRLRLTVQEMNYASRRLVELQARVP